MPYTGRRSRYLDYCTMAVLTPRDNDLNPVLGPRVTAHQIKYIKISYDGKLFLLNLVDQTVYHESLGRQVRDNKDSQPPTSG